MTNPNDPILSSNGASQASDNNLGYNFPTTPVAIPAVTDMNQSNITTPVSQPVTNEFSANPISPFSASPAFPSSENQVFADQITNPVTNQQNAPINNNFSPAVESINPINNFNNPVPATPVEQPATNNNLPGYIDFASAFQQAEEKAASNSFKQSIPDLGIDAAQPAAPINPIDTNQLGGTIEQTIPTQTAPIPASSNFIDQFTQDLNQNPVMSQPSIPDIQPIQPLDNVSTMNDMQPATFTAPAQSQSIADSLTAFQSATIPSVEALPVMPTSPTELPPIIEPTPVIAVQPSIAPVQVAAVSSTIPPIVSTGLPEFKAVQQPAEHKEGNSEGSKLRVILILLGSILVGLLALLVGIYMATKGM